MAEFIGKSPVADTKGKTSAMNCDGTASRRPELQWENLLAEFRALGGTAENVTVGCGQSGRGLFPIDAAKPVRLRTPSNLLVPSRDTELRDGQLVVRTSAPLGEWERAFFDRYQKDFSWGAHTLDDLWQTQIAWGDLPKCVKDKLKEIGPVDKDRFSEPSPDLCYKRYLSTRQLSFRNRLVLVPIIELINHRDQAGQLDCRDGIGIEGKFSEEIVADYCPDDCWGMATTYVFSAPRRWAHSLELNLDFEGRHIRVAREFQRVQRFNNVPVPIAATEGDTIVISFLMLGHIIFPRIPRAVFLHIAQDMPIRRPNELFDLIQHHNRMKLLSFLRISDGSTGTLISVLRNAAFQQLETLSGYFGTRSLAAIP